MIVILASFWILSREKVGRCILKKTKKCKKIRRVHTCCVGSEQLSLSIYLVATAVNYRAPHFNSENRSLCSIFKIKRVALFE